VSFAIVDSGSPTDHILGTFPLVFPADAQGKARRAALLAVFEEMG